MNERAFLAQLESANTEELSQLLRRPTAEEERVLEIYFGRERLQRLRGLALRSQQRATPRGNVVVLHGIMGGEMTVSPDQPKGAIHLAELPAPCHRRGRMAANDSDLDVGIQRPGHRHS